MAIGDAVATKGYVPKLQPSTQLHKPSLEPEPPRTKKERSNMQARHQFPLLFTRELEEDLGFDAVDLHHDWSFHMEVLTIQAEECVQGNGLLSSHG